LKLLQLNAWGGRLEYAIDDLLHVEKPDILCLQEAISFEAEGSGLFITLENVQKEHNLPYRAFGPVFSFSYMKGVAKFGNAVLSRRPINKSKVVFTHLEHQDDYMWGEHSNNMRNFVHAVIDVDGRPCHIITHHGFWVPDHKQGNSETLKQMKHLADYIKTLEGPIILTGDFNLSPDSESLRELNGMLTNLSIEHRLKTTRTNLTYKTETCDYIFVSKAVKIKSFEALDKVVSDHKALKLEFELRKA